MAMQPPEELLDSYMNNHGFLDLIGGMMENLLREKPPNPIDAMIEYLESQKTAAKGFGKKTSKKVIVILGPPGAGKTAMCEYVVKEFGYARVGVRDLLRAEIKSGSQEGRIALQALREGTVVPGNITLNLVRRAIQKEGNKVVLEGFPRSYEQALKFDESIGADLFLWLDCEEELGVRRLQNDTKIQQAQAALGEMSDDLLWKRVKLFTDTTMVAVRHYERQDRIHRVDTNRGLDEVWAEVKNIIKASNI